MFSISCPFPVLLTSHSIKLKTNSNAEGSKLKGGKILKLMEIDSSSEMKSMTRLLSSACHRSFPASHAHGVVTSAPQGTVCSQGSLVDRNMNSYFYPDRSHSDLWFAYRAHWWNRQLTSCLTCITWHLPFLLMLLFFFSRALFSPHSKLPCLSRQSEAFLPICVYIWTARAFLYLPKEGYIIKVIFFTFHKEESLHIYTHTHTMNIYSFLF